MTTSSQTCYVGGEPATATCTVCGKPICAEHSKLGQPFISAGELLRTALRSPSMLFAPPMAEVPYCPECREIVAGQRTTEQLKVMLGFLAIIGVIIALIYFIAS